MERTPLANLEPLRLAEGGTGRRGSRGPRRHPSEGATAHYVPPVVWFACSVASAIRADPRIGAEITSNGTDYLLLGTRRNVGCGQSFRGIEAVAARVGPTLEPLDLSGFPVNHPTGLGPAVVAVVGLAFDGTQCVASFLDQASPCGYAVFGARITADGQIFDPDAPGRACFYYVIQGAYTLTLAPTKPTVWRAKAVSVTVATGDVGDAVVAVRPAL